MRTRSRAEVRLTTVNVLARLRKKSKRRRKRDPAGYKNVKLVLNMLRRERDASGALLR